MLYGTQNIAWDNLLSIFYEEQIEFITKIYLLDWVCKLIRKYILPFSFKAATPCSINASKNITQDISKTTTSFT